MSLHCTMTYCTICCYILHDAMLYDIRLCYYIDYMCVYIYITHSPTDKQGQQKHMLLFDFAQISICHYESAWKYRVVIDSPMENTSKPKKNNKNTEKLIYN